MEDIACPRCKTTKYRNPNLKLMVNSCGHALCENCVDLLFVKGSAACPQCNVTIRRNNFRLQIFEDAAVEKEVDIRRRILKDFNKKEVDFNSLRDYNDYLEEVETIIYNLANDIDIELTKRKVEQYKKENKAQIIKNRGKLSKDEEALEELLEIEMQETEVRKHQFVEEEKELEKAKVKKKEALIDDLMFSDLPATEIIATHSLQKQETFKPPPSRKKEVKFSTGIKLRNQQVFLPVPKQNEENMYTYTELHLDLCGPEAPHSTDLESEGYLQHVRAAADSDKAGGFVSQYACHRALEEAFCGIYFVVEHS